MRQHGLLLARHTAERPGRVHDGKVIVMRSNLRWCSDGLEFTCRNGDVVRIAFAIDAHDQEIIAWRAVARDGLWQAIADALPQFFAEECAIYFNAAVYGRI